MPNVSAEEREFIMTGIRDKAADEDVL
jgi:hypothetical protein